MAKENIILKVRKILRRDLEETKDGTIYSQSLADVYDEYEDEMLANPKTKHIDLSGDLKKSAAGPDNESTVDGVHLTDVGFLRLAEFLYKELKEIK